VITVLSLNTAIDRTLMVPSLRLGQVHRARRVWTEAGGKGLNVARVVRQLGEPVRVLGFLGGEAQRFIEERCAELGIEQRWIEIGGQSRTCVIVADPETGRQTVVNEQGPEIRAEEVERLLATLEATLAAGDLLSLAGSLPPKMPADFYARVIQIGQQADVRVLVDAGGETLRLALEAQPWAAAPNEEECSAALGSAQTPLALAHRLAEHCDCGLLTLGPAGLIVASGQGTYRVQPLEAPAVNAVGSGDAFVAGFLVGTVGKLPANEAARLGAACGAANAGRFEQGIGSRSEVETLLPRVRTERL